MASITYGTTGGGHVVPLPGPFDRSEAAHHESGHAVARWALGSPFLRLNLDGPPCPMVEPLPGATIAPGPHMLIGACGLIGDYQKRGLSIRGSQIAKLLLGSPDGLDAAATGKMAHRLTNRAQAVAPGVDLFQMAGKPPGSRARPLFGPYSCSAPRWRYAPR